MKRREAVAIFAQITSQYVKKVLTEREYLLASNRRRIRKVYKELGNSDRAVKEVAYQKQNIEMFGMGTMIQSPGNKDLTEIILRHQRVQEEQNRDLRYELLNLIDEQETINRIWICYNAYHGPGKEYLEELYVNHRLYKDVEQMSGVTHSPFERARKRALREIKNLYHSELSNLEIIRMKEVKGKERKRDLKQENYFQMELNIGKK